MRQFSQLEAATGNEKALVIYRHNVRNNPWRREGSTLLILAEHMIVAVNHIVTGYYRSIAGSLWRARQEERSAQDRVITLDR